jgi:hypothetical protein
MRSIRYSLHFPLLVVALLVFWLAEGIHFPVWISNFDFFKFGLTGVLHATALVVSLRDHRGENPFIALCFIALAGMWSAATPILGLWGSIVWTPIIRTPLAESLRPPDIGFAIIFLTGSAIGAAGYWLLVRLFWLKLLRRVDCLRTIALCVAATLLAFVAIELLPKGLPVRVTSLVITAAWWFAFSISLYWSEASVYADKSAEGMASANLNA